MIDIFVDGINRGGTHAGVLEGDDQVGWFYLYELKGETIGGIAGAVQVYRGFPDFAASDVEVRWYDEETKVGVFIKGKLRAYFDLVAGMGYLVKSENGETRGNA